LAISPKPWLELRNEDKNTFVSGGFLHLALAGTISRADGELDPEHGDIRVRASLPRVARVRKKNGNDTRSAAAA
jgi:hypothetical protein